MYKRQVHARGGKIVIQLWHVGRISHPDLQEGGALPVAPSAVTPKGWVFTGRGREEMVDVYKRQAPAHSGSSCDSSQSSVGFFYIRLRVIATSFSTYCNRR